MPPSPPTPLSRVSKHRFPTFSDNPPDVDAWCRGPKIPSAEALDLAIAKHVGVLEKAGLVKKRQHGKERVVSLAPEAIRTAEAHLGEYEKLWSARFNEEGLSMAQDQLQLLLAE